MPGVSSLTLSPSICKNVCEYLYRVADQGTWESGWKGSDSRKLVEQFINAHGGESICFRDWLNDYNTMGDTHFVRTKSDELGVHRVSLGNSCSILDQRTLVRMIHATCKKYLGDSL
jgi:hypothetical protein